MRGLDGMGLLENETGRRILQAGHGHDRPPAPVLPGGVDVVMLLVPVDVEALRLPAQSGVGGYSVFLRNKRGNDALPD